MDWDRSIVCEKQKSNFDNTDENNLNTEIMKKPHVRMTGWNKIDKHHPKSPSIDTTIISNNVNLDYKTHFTVQHHVKKIQKQILEQAKN